MTSRSWRWSAVVVAVLCGLCCDYHIRSAVEIDVFSPVCVLMAPGGVPDPDMAAARTFIWIEVWNRRVYTGYTAEQAGDLWLGRNAGAVTHGIGALCGGFATLGVWFVQRPWLPPMARAGDDSPGGP